MLKNIFKSVDNLKSTYGIGAYAVFSVALLVIHYLLNLDALSSVHQFIPFLKKLTMTLFLVSVILLIAKIIERLIINNTETRGHQYNLLRVTKLLSILFIIIIVGSFLFQNLYAAAVSFGLISLVLGFALRAPIASFISWLYIVFRRPYLVGDRIQVGELRGDVIEINYLHTKIWECSGDYLGNDRRSGRIIHFPNSLIFSDEVINYSGPQSPFIWNETPLQVAYTSDLQFVEDCLLKATIQDFEDRYPKMYEQDQDKWQPAVYFRVNQYAWVEAVISYPVEPSDTTRRRNCILRTALPMLNEQPDKVAFPEGTQR